MKIGLVSAILENLNFQEVIDCIAQEGLDCVEVACWPKGGADRRYAGVCHIDVENLTKQEADKVKEYCTDKNVTISALAYYDNPLDPDENKSLNAINHLYRVIDAAELLGVSLVTTFIGRNPFHNEEESFEDVKRVWPGIISYAAERQIRIGIENCPMLFTEDEWPGGKNIMTTPKNWRRVFEILDSPFIGLNYDPSHFIWQQMDYISPIYEFKDKIFHVHFKDIKLSKDRMSDVGIMATPLQYMTPKIPGLGDVDWGKFASALTDIGFDGNACIEIEDKAFEKSGQSIRKAISLSHKYISHYVA